MKRFSKKFLTVFLLGTPLFSASQAFSADDVKSAAVALAKIYKLENLASEFLFGSFAATDAEPTASAKNSNNDKKPSYSGFKIKSLKKLRYKIDQNQFFDLRNGALHYVLKIRF